MSFFWICPCQLLCAPFKGPADSSFHVSFYSSHPKSSSPLSSRGGRSIVSRLPQPPSFEPYLSWNCCSACHAKAWSSDERSPCVVLRHMGDQKQSNARPVLPAAKTCFFKGQWGGQAHLPWGCALSPEAKKESLMDDVVTANSVDGTDALRTSC